MDFRGPPPSNAGRRLRVRLVQAACLLTLSAAAVACSGGGTSSGTDVGTDLGAASDVGGCDCEQADLAPDGGEPRGFDDHTHGAFREVSELRSFLVGGEALQQAKLILVGFPDPELRELRFMDGGFYVFHDEWYWFRLLNGQPVVGAEAAPVYGLSFDTVEEVRRWASEQQELPLDLKWGSDGRLYSPAFYKLGLSAPRQLGLGGLVRLPPDPGRQLPERWFFELEYSDDVSHAELTIFFEELMAALPPEVGAGLRWIVRSPAQEALAQQMEADRLLYWDRIARYSELATPGEVEVYNGGLTAGRLRMFRAGDPEVQSVDAKTVLGLDYVPDWLPPGAALLTSVPQTPLAHINILARNRGIPNAYLGGLLDDPDLAQRARARAAVLVHAELPASLTVLPITDGQYSRYRSLLRTPPVEIEPVDPAGLALVEELEGRPLSDMDLLRPAVGGKSAGTLALANVLGGDPAPVSAVHRPLAITLRAYAEHLAPLLPRIDAMLAAPEFSDAREEDPGVRLLVLEGQRGYGARHGDGPALAALRAFLPEHPPGDPLGDLVRAGGLCELIRQQPVPATTLAELRAALEGRYGDYDPRQGLRFRSSSTVEDIQGFNGAGLYSSHTGYLWPERHPDGEDSVASVADALRRTWASYWGSEAFEERRLARVEHLAGYMAVTVHPAFPDRLERANGVFTLTLLPPGHEHAACMDLNVQAGALSVANPETGSGVLPEVDLVCQGADRAGPVVVQRLRPSTEVPAGSWVLTDEALGQVLRAGRAVSEGWLQASNGGLSSARAARSVVLDFELKWMAPGWPRLAETPPLPERLVLKQVRSLEPNLGRLPEDLHARPFPRDLLARARRVERISCDSAAFTFITYEAYTDPALHPDQGHSEQPFNALAGLIIRRDIGSLDLHAGDSAGADHREYANIAHPTLGLDEWSLSLTLAPSAVERTGVELIEVSTAGRWRLARGERGARGDGLDCEREVLYASPQDYLMGLLQTAERP